MLKGKNFQPSMLYPSRLLFRIEREIRNFTDKYVKSSPILNQPMRNVKRDFFRRKRKDPN